MGWAYFDSRGRSTAELLHEEIDGETGRIIDLAQVGSTVYAAYRFNSDSSDYRAGQTIGLVVLTKRDKRARDGMDFGYKDMSESMGPCEDHCPERILDLLTPADSEYANEWRERCRAYHAKRRTTTLSNGQVITFAAPLNFGSFEEATFTVVRYGKTGRKLGFRAQSNGVLCQITNLYDRQFTTEPAA